MILAAAIKISRMAVMRDAVYLSLRSEFKVIALRQIAAGGNDFRPPVSRQGGRSSGWRDVIRCRGGEGRATLRHGRIIAAVEAGDAQVATCDGGGRGQVVRRSDCAQAAGGERGVCWADRRDGTAWRAVDQAGIRPAAVAGQVAAAQAIRGH